MAEYTMGAMGFLPDTDSIALTSVDFATNAIVTDDGAGLIYAQFQAMTNWAPLASVTTKCIRRMLTEIATNGTCVGAGKSITQVDIYSRKMETCKDPLGGTPHMRDSTADGLLRLGIMQATRGEDATFSITLDSFTDGTNAPVARTDGVDIPTPILSERFTLGACKIAGTIFEEIDSVTIDYGISITEKMPKLGSIWPDSAGVLTVRPVLTLVGRDLSKVQEGIFELGANAAAHADTEIWLIARQPNGTFEPFTGSPAGEKHIRFTMAGLAFSDMLVSSAPGSRATHTITLPGAVDGNDNAPIIPAWDQQYQP